MSEPARETADVDKVAGMSTRIAVVTGATGGIGRRIVEDLARDHRVFALGRNAEKLAELGGLAGVEAVETDLDRELLDSDPGEALARVLGQERIDVLVHAAAIAQRHTVESARPADWRGMFDTNVFVPAELTRRLLPALRQAEGLAVFINSGAGKGAYPGNAVYAATKHALYALTDALRKEEANAGVRISTVAPGPTDTPMLQGLNSQAGGGYQRELYIEPEEVAQAVRSAVAAGASAQLTDIVVRPRVELADRN